MGGALFVAFEGGEGSGKSTQIALLADALGALGRDVLVTREPGATALGREIRELLLHADEAVSARAEALLFAADRAHHVDTVVRPALDAGTIVLCDRYVDSSLAYQGAGRALAVEDVRTISRWATRDLRPDLTVLLDIAPVDGLARARGDGTGDKLEAESPEFHVQVRAAFLDLAAAAPRSYLVLDATRPVADLAADVLSAVRAALPCGSGESRDGAS